MPVSFTFSQTRYSRQTAIAVEASQAVLHRSNEAIKANEQALHSIQKALNRSRDVISASRHALAEHTRRPAAWKRRGF